MKKSELIRRQIRLEKEIAECKRQIPRKKYEVVNSAGDKVIVEAHGYNFEENRYYFWIHPWENIADFTNPISVMEIN